MLFTLVSVDSAPPPLLTSFDLTYRFKLQMQTQ